MEPAKLGLFSSLVNSLRDDSYFGLAGLASAARAGMANNFMAHATRTELNVVVALLRSATTRPCRSGDRRVARCNYRHPYRFFSNLPPRRTAARPLRRLGIICCRIEHQYLAPKPLELAGYCPLTRDWYRA